MNDNIDKLSKYPINNRGDGERNLRPRDMEFKIHYASHQVRINRSNNTVITTCGIMAMVPGYDLAGSHNDRSRTT